MRRLVTNRHFVTYYLSDINYADDTSVSNDVIGGTNIAQNSFYIHKMAI